ncbi:MAG: DNA primase, partial [Nitrospinaceae bacterium]|nr:DNA primase [Nitrospinaceae bacterium]NIR53584.1 DNA primase [Nitrospinaceae bacterium]NIS83985.1 DNA primase [Nitrospinaceae bacterium]NIT80794.1 DNA primase [Nitrospinaceae bacterium]NIU43100.1 DNA primase [Nitrospinaceae bacterium]
CPFHSEKTPSFNVSPDKQIYHCFGCGAGGNVFKFLMTREDLSFVEAVKRLAQRYRVALPAAAMGSPGVSNERDTLLNLNTLAAEYFAGRLEDPRTGKSARAYLKSREFNEQTVREYQIGWALPEWRDLLTHLEKKGKCSRQTLEKAGLVSKKEAENENEKDVFYDRFRGRLIFPIQDAHGHIVGFGGRVIGEGEPKYLNSPETLIYKKNRILFGLHKAKETIRRESEVLIVEGYFDQIRAWENGIHNAVATCGTALTAQHATLLKPFASKAVMVFDADAAGHAAAERGFETLQEQGLSVFVVTLPEGEDPDSLLRKEGKDRFEQRVRAAQPFVHYLVDRILRLAPARTTEDKVGAINRILPVLAKIKNSVERSEHIRYVAEKVGVEDRAFLEEMRKSLAQNKNQVTAPSNTKTSTHDPEFYLIQLILTDPAAARDIASQVGLEHYLIPEIRDTAALLYGLIETDEPLRVDRLIDRTDQPAVKSVLTQVSMKPITFDNVARATTDCINEIRNRSIQKKINQLKKERNEAEQAGQRDRSRELHQQMRDMQFSMLPK